MKERLIKNLGLKILSLFLAFIIWLIVVNVSNPLVNNRREIPLDIENDQVLAAARRAYEIVGKNTVTVSFDVHARDIYKVQPSDFRAYIDLSELYDVTGSVPVKVEVLKNDDIYYNVSSRPGVVQVKTEDIQTKPFEVMAEAEGRAADGYDFAGIALSPDIVTVEGPMSQVGLINHVGVKINIDGISSDTEGQTMLQFYDGNGKELPLDERVHTDVDETGVNYTVYVNKIKEVSLDFEVEGTAAPGYRYIGVECPKRSVLVTGSRSGLASLNVLVISSPVLDIDGATQDKTVTVDIREFLPEGVRIADSENPNIEIRILVEPLVKKSVELDEGAIAVTGKEEGWEYRLEPSRISVTVRGLKEDLEELSSEDLEASMNFAGLSEGVHPGVLHFEESERFDVVSYGEFQVEVTPPGGMEETGIHTHEPVGGEEGTEGSPEQALQADGPGITDPAAEAGAPPVPASGDEEKETAASE